MEKTNSKETENFLPFSASDSRCVPASTVNEARVLTTTASFLQKCDSFSEQAHWVRQEARAINTMGLRILMHSAREQDRSYANHLDLAFASLWVLGLSALLMLFYHSFVLYDWSTLSCFGHCMSRTMWTNWKVSSGQHQNLLQVGKHGREERLKELRLFCLEKKRQGGEGQNLIIAFKYIMGCYKENYKRSIPLSIHTNMRTGTM